MRESSSAEAANAMMKNLVEHLFTIEEELHNQTPKEILNAIDRLEKEIQANKFSKIKTRKQFLLRQLKKYLTLSCFGFNSGK